MKEFLLTTSLKIYLSIWIVTELFRDKYTQFKGNSNQ
jgi:hypothetical protein